MPVVKIVRLAAVVLAVPAVVLAADPWDAGGPLDTCLAAAIKARPGIVTGWRQAGGGPQPPYAVSVLDKEGRTAETTCDPVKPENLQFTNKGGLLRYEMYLSATVPEAEARVDAPKLFTGPVRVFDMHYTVSMTGKPYYRYQMFLPSGHKATVDIDGILGRVVKAEAK
jgi:hypothetical protein